MAIISFSAVAQGATTRFGLRRVLPLGLAIAAVTVASFGRLPVHGHYFWDLFPAFVVGGVGLALAFVPLTIGGLTGVSEEQAGVASGLINTSQQIGGAIGVAVASTIAATFTNRYLDSHPGAGGLNPAALTHGFSIAFYVLAAIAGFAAIATFVLLEPRRPEPVVEVDEGALPEALAA